MERQYYVGYGPRQGENEMNKGKALKHQLQNAGETLQNEIRKYKDENSGA